MPKTSDLVQKTTLVAADEILIVDSAVVDPTSDEATKYVTEANFSAQVQDDLMANAAVTEATVATDTVPILASSVNSKITLQNLMIQMKGYKEYTFAIRQSGTDAPTLTVRHSDYGNIILPSSRSSAGMYFIDITSLNLTLGSNTNIGLSNYRGDTDLGALTFGVYFSSATQIVLESRVNNLSLDDSFNDRNGITMSIVESIYTASGGGVWTAITGYGTPDWDATETALGLL